MPTASGRAIFQDRLSVFHFRTQQAHAQVRAAINSPETQASAVPQFRSRTMSALAGEDISRCSLLQISASPET